MAARTSAPCDAEGGGDQYRTFGPPGGGGLGMEPRTTCLLLIEFQNEFASAGAVGADHIVRFTSCKFRGSGTLPRDPGCSQVALVS